MVRPEPPDAYRALDGTLVQIPPMRPLRDGPMPVFGAQDHGWLDHLIAFRDRATGHDVDHADRVANTVSDDNENYGVPPEMREYLQAHLDRSRKIAAEILATAEVRGAEARRRFGPDGLGFLAELNTGAALVDFWGTLNALLYQRIPLLQYYAPEEKRIVRDLLARFPERVWLPIIAQVCWPRLEHRQHEHEYDLMDRYLASDHADFRQLETGAAKPERPDDPGQVIYDTITKLTWGQFRALAALKRITTTPFEGEQDDELRLADKTTRLVREFGTEANLTKMQADLVTELLDQYRPVRRHDDGVVQSELNWIKLNSLQQSLGTIAPGPPEGHYMRYALSKRPNGFMGINFAHHRRELVWPYIATHLDMIDRAMGLAEPFPFEPAFERDKAIAMLRLLPKPPARYADILLEVATGPSAGGRADAQALLTGAKALAPDAATRLEDSKAAIREHAARTLGAIGDTSRAGTLRAARETERSAKVRAAIDDALAALGAAGPDTGHDLIAETQAALVRPLSEANAWIADLAPPPLHATDGTPLPPGTGQGLLRLALVRGTPTGSAAVDALLAGLAPKDRTALARWTLQAWIDYDTRPWPEAQMAKWRDEAEQEVWRTYTYERRRYARLTPAERPRHGSYTPKRELERPEPRTLAEVVTLLRCQYDGALGRRIAYAGFPQTAIAAKNLLAIAAQAGPAPIAKAVRAYLRDHAKRTSQSKALLDLLHAAGDPAGARLLAEIAETQPQKSLRAHARKLLGH